MEPFVEKPDMTEYEEPEETRNTETKTVDPSEVDDVPLSGGGSKPVFDVITKVKVTKVELKQGGMTPSKDREGDYRLNYYLQVNMQDDAGTDLWENYGGLAVYYNNVESGTPSKNKYIGPQSFYNRLRETVADQFGEDAAASNQALIDTLTGKTVGIKSEEISLIGGGKSHKNVIKQIYTD